MNIAKLGKENYVYSIDDDFMLGGGVARSAF
jgi:hypothetical protein